MPGRLAVALAVLVGSLALSALVWFVVGEPLLFLAVPLVPFLFWRRGGSPPPDRRCPVCGFETREPEIAYCPRDGTELERVSDDRS